MEIIVDQRYCYITACGNAYLVVVLQDFTDGTYSCKVIQRHARLPVVAHDLGEIITIHGNYLQPAEEFAKT